MSPATRTQSTTQGLRRLPQNRPDGTGNKCLDQARMRPSFEAFQSVLIKGRVLTVSEYQFYEFVAVDGPVTEDEAPYPWSVSSRAEVTPRRWRNVYNWGDFHGSVN